MRYRPLMLPLLLLEEEGILLNGELGDQFPSLLLPDPEEGEEECRETLLSATTKRRRLVLLRAKKSAATTAL